MQYLKRLIKFFNVVVLVLGLLIPLALFLNRFLIPDVSFDSLNYHLYLGFKGLNWQNNQFEFYPTGIYNFSSILEIFGYILMQVFGYRIGTIGSLIFLYLSIIVLYKIFRLYNPKVKVLGRWWFGLVFVSMFLSFEAFLQISTYYIDIEVAFLMLLVWYFLLKYEKKKKLINLLMSAVMMAFLLLGKMTTWYFLLPYFGYLFLTLLKDKKQTIKQKLFKFLLVGVISISLLIPWMFNNFRVTGNPVFPFYNGIFNSEYFIDENFSQGFGGIGFLEKLFYWFYSAKNPIKLGEVHDLFTDYKISIYFITSVVILFWAWYRKDKEIVKFSVFYLITYLCWSFTFGYLRYGLLLEFLGGLLLLMFFVRLKTSWKYLIIASITIIMVIQGKRIVNMSLAYDISFRSGYFYNRVTYPEEIKNLNKNEISINVDDMERYQPNVYLNCAIPNLAYYVLSDFNNLPVLNIDFRANGDLVSNLEYNSKIGLKLRRYHDNGSKIRFVTITTKEGLNSQYLDCINNLKNKNYIILEEIPFNDFLGYSGQKLVMIFGEFELI
ncbi:MAG: hypothetical protein PHX34_04270 [Candidatus Shapirobacteria bacterium]|nr:hypothetical protein [Candidatus Shapirobacteria bacterium]